MSVEFTVLASGSRGNCSLVRAGGSGILIDLGLGTRMMAQRMDASGIGWDRITSALLTHTHGDHVSDSTLRALAKHGTPLYCHEGHHGVLSKKAGYKALARNGGVREFDEDRPFLTPDGLRVEPITLSHDGGPTFGFRIEARPGRRGRSVSVGYVADTGCWRPETVQGLIDVDILGVEFNHDVELQKTSGRAPYLIWRNLGDRGHLSNDQGAALVASVLNDSARGAVRHIVLLHMSEECNRPELAMTAARSAVRSAGRSSKIHLARQWDAFPSLPVEPARRTKANATYPWERPMPRKRDSAPAQLAFS